MAAVDRRRRHDALIPAASLPWAAAAAATPRLLRSSETFNATELPFAREVCDAVAQTWRPTRDHKMIVNLPASVEAATPNVFADQIEWMHRNLGYHDSIVLSAHPRNDRGTAVAAAQLALLAGAERIEGCLAMASAPATWIWACSRSISTRWASIAVWT
jgi:isopropylmalate/homocitrate/citramalate synthase